MDNIKSYKLFEDSGQRVPDDNKDVNFVKDVFVDIKDLGAKIKIWGYEDYGDSKNIRIRCITELRSNFSFYGMVEKPSGDEFQKIDKTISSIKELYDELKSCTSTCVEYGLLLDSFIISTNQNYNEKDIIYSCIDFIRVVT
jgi:hypothetical protein